MKNRITLKSNSGDVYIIHVRHFGLIDPVNGFKYKKKKKSSLNEK